jgi:flagellar FliL protein
MASKPSKADREEAEKQADETDGDAAAAPKRKLPLKLIVIAAAALIVLGGGGAAAFFMFGHHKEEAAPEVAKAKPAVFFDVPEVLVNLSTSGGERTQYLKVKIVLEVPEQKVVTQITPIMPRVMDAFQTYLRELRPSDLEGSAGLYRLKEELTRRVNASIAPNRINAVLFKEIVVQ